MNEKLKDLKVAVLYGGTSGEREVSLRSGKKVHESLVSQGLNAYLVDTKEDFIAMLKENRPDVAFITVHGRGGEDGVLQGTLEALGIKYSGSGVLASAAAMNKIASKRIWIGAGVPTPKFYLFDNSSDLKEQCERLLRTFPLPLVLKPVSEGSSLGVNIMTKPEDLLPSVKNTIAEFGDAFAEEFIKGTQVTVGIIDDGGKLKALPVLELVPKADFYDFKAKYTAGMTQFIVPARLPKLVYSRVQAAAIDAFIALECRGLARIDFIIDSDGTPFAHDANTIPGMTDLSDLPAQAAADGISYDELVIKILESALK